MSEEALLHKILIYPIKGLEPIEVNSARITNKGSLLHDREFALLDKEGNIVSGKREKKLHSIKSLVDFETQVMAFRYSGRLYEFSFEEVKAIEDFFSETLGYRVYMKRFPDGGMPDDREAHGPTLVSKETLSEIASWYNVTEDNIRRRFRANIELSGVPPFWEDRLVKAHSKVRFRIGGVLFEGVGISKRCPVPTRDPDSGEETKGFVKTFVEKRRKLLPPWAPKERFADTFYKLCLNTNVPASESGKEIRVGDRLSIEGG